MAIQKKALNGAATSRLKETVGASGIKPEAKPESVNAPATRKLAVAKLATAKLTTARMLTLKKLS